MNWKYFICLVVGHRPLENLRGWCGRCYNRCEPGRRL